MKFMYGAVLVATLMCSNACSQAQKSPEVLAGLEVFEMFPKGGCTESTNIYRCLHGNWQGTVTDKSNGQVYTLMRGSLGHEIYYGERDTLEAHYYDFQYTDTGMICAEWHVDASVPKKRYPCTARERTNIEKALIKIGQLARAEGVQPATD